MITNIKDIHQWITTKVHQSLNVTHYFYNNFIDHTLSQYHSQMLNERLQAMLQILCKRMLVVIVACSMSHVHAYRCEWVKLVVASLANRDKIGESIASILYPWHKARMYVIYHCSTFTVTNRGSQCPTRVMYPFSFIWACDFNGVSLTSRSTFVWITEHVKLWFPLDPLCYTILDAHITTHPAPRT